MRIRLNRTNIKALEPRNSSYYVSDVDFPAFRVRITPKGAATFYLLYRNAQNRQITFKIGVFGEVSPETARDIAEKKMAEVKLGGDPAGDKVEAKKQAERAKYFTLSGFLNEKFEPWAVANRKTGANMVGRIRSVFADYLDKPLEEITPWIIEKWRKDRFKQGRAVGTVNKDIAVLKSCLSRAVDWGVIDVHPLRRLKLSKEDRRGVVRYLSDEEERRLRRALSSRDANIKRGRESGNAWRRERGKVLLPEITGPFGDHITPMVLLSLNTGMRRGEVFNLKWSDIDFKNESLVIHGHSTKSGTTRHVPLNSEALDTLKAWQGQQELGHCLVFPSRAGGPLDNVKKGWEALLVNAGITQFRWHDMRHHFASKLVMAGVDLNTVRELLGHSDFKLTLRYAHLAPEHKAAAVAKLVESV
ncbi:MAG: site-specific integrase [Chromatiaceae bacterium]|nr:site-specific integrase [Chromatiaceae bacterium]